jgi:20S proteasome subunit alpha 5
LLQRITLDEALQLALKVLRQVMEEKLEATNVEVATITADTKKFRLLSKEEVQQIINKLPKKEEEEDKDKETATE